MLELRGFYDDGFWDGTLLRMSYSTRFIEQFIIALSSLDEAFRLREEPHQISSALKMYAFSLDHYQQAVRGLLASSGLGQDVGLVLASCVVCTTVEMWLGDNGAAYRHITAGYMLACQELETAFATSESSPKRLLPVITRLGRQVGLQVAQPCPLPDYDGAGATTLPKTSTMSTLNDAHRCFYEAVESFVIRAESLTPELAGLEAQSLIDDLDEWYARLTAILNRRTRNSRGFHLLAIHYFLIRSKVQAAATRNELEYDSHTADFRQVIAHCESWIRLGGKRETSTVVTRRTCEGAVGMALLNVAVKCRHSQLRRKALRVAYRSRLSEGIHSITLVCALAEHRMVIEERNALQAAGQVQGVPQGVDRLYLEGLHYHPGVLAGGRDCQMPDMWELDPPKIMSDYRTLDNQIVNTSITLKPYTSAGGFGMKSCFWYPVISTDQPSILDEEIPEETRHLEGPHPGYLPFEGQVKDDIRSEVYLQSLTITIKSG